MNAASRHKTSTSANATRAGTWPATDATVAQQSKGKKSQPRTAPTPTKKAEYVSPSTSTPTLKQMKIPTTKNQREEKTHANARRRTARWQIGRVTTRLLPTRRTSELAPRNGANRWKNMAPRGEANRRQYQNLPVTSKAVRVRLCAPPNTRKHMSREPKTKKQSKSKHARNLTAKTDEITEHRGTIARLCNDKKRVKHTRTSRPTYGHRNAKPFWLKRTRPACRILDNKPILHVGTAATCPSSESNCG